jgi:ATP-binding cassette subfamily C protein CydC
MPASRRFVPALLLGMLASACAVALLATSSWLITRAAEQPPILYLTFAIVGVRAFALGRAFFRYLERLGSHDAAFRGLGALRVAIYRRMLVLGPDGVAGTGRGDLLARLVADVDRLQDLPLRIVQPVASAVVVGLLSVIGVGLASPPAALILALCLLVAVAVAVLVQSRLGANGEREIAPARARLDELVLAHVSRLDVLTAFDADGASASRIADADAALRDAQIRRARGAGATAGIGSLFSGLAMALVLGIVPASSVSGPVFALVVLVPIAVFEVVLAVPVAFSAWREVAVSAERVATAVPSGVAPELPAAPAQPVALPASVDIELRDLSARWPGSPRDALSGVSLDLPAGSRLLVTGASGAGKTTLAHVLVRFLDYSGSYRIGGVEARDLDPDELRRVVGLCEQRPHIFDDSVRHNLDFAREGASEEELLAAIDRVGLGGWLAERGGLDARVGERGALVSGGQAQRIALARALLAGFPVLVLDEPTANVDVARADELVSDLLESAAAEGRSVLLISHVPVVSPLVTGELQLH